MSSPFYLHNKFNEQKLTQSALKKDTFTLRSLKTIDPSSSTYPRQGRGGLT